MPALITDKSFTDKLTALKAYATKEANWNNVEGIIKGEESSPGSKKDYVAVVDLVYVSLEVAQQLRVRVVYTIDILPTLKPLDPPAHHLSISVLENPPKNVVWFVLYNIVKALGLPEPPEYYGPSPNDEGLHYIVSLRDKTTEAHATA